MDDKLDIVKVPCILDCRSTDKATASIAQDIQSPDPSADVVDKILIESVEVKIESSVRPT